MLRNSNSFIVLAGYGFLDGLNPPGCHNQGRAYSLCSGEQSVKLARDSDPL